MQVKSADQTGAALTTLQRRSELLEALRKFFWQQGFLEVETPLLSGEVIPELNIEPMCMEHKGSPRWLQSSPELHMKRLLAAGMQAIFQVTRSFRSREQGPLHQSEFTIVEWYQVGDDMLAGMDFLDQLCQAVARTPPAKRTSYAEAFRTHAAICPHTATIGQLAERAAALEISAAAGLPENDRDQWLNLLLAFQVEPQLGRIEPELLYNYPASQAALAKVVQGDDGNRVAQRFEMYWQGIEIANGYHELTDSAELRQRLTEVNRHRSAAGQPSLPLPESLLAAMDEGLPDCAGCAMGFDRLAMVALEKPSIASVRAFTAD